MKNNKQIDEQIIRSIKKRGVDIRKISQIEKGINSRVFCLETTKEKLILKFYPKRDLMNFRNRLEAEIKFLNFLKSFGQKNIPTPLHWDLKNNWALLSFIDGEEITIVNSEVTNSVINFFENLYNYKYSSTAQNIQNAAEACFSFEDHFELIERRLIKVQNFFEDVNFNSDINDWLNDVLIKDLYNLKKEIRKYKTVNLFKEKIKYEEMVLSPSDVGIHNMLVKKNQFFFFDFEYSGWDDVSKFCSDWILRPNQKFEVNCKKQFIDKIKKIIDSNLFLDRLEYMLPLYKLKWVLIIFNGIYKENLQIDSLFKKVKQYHCNSFDLN